MQAVAVASQTGYPCGLRVGASWGVCPWLRLILHRCMPWVWGMPWVAAVLVTVRAGQSQENPCPSSIQLCALVPDLMMGTCSCTPLADQSRRAVRARDAE